MDATDLHNITQPRCYNYVMNDIQPYQFEPEGTWQEEDYSNGSEINTQEKL